MAIYHYAAEHRLSNRRLDGTFETRYDPSEDGWHVTIRKFISERFEPPVPPDEMHVASLTKLKD